MLSDVKKHRSSLNYRRAPGDDKRAGRGPSGVDRSKVPERRYVPRYICMYLMYCTVYLIYLVPTPFGYVR